MRARSAAMRDDDLLKTSLNETRPARRQQQRCHRRPRDGSRKLTDRLAIDRVCKVFSDNPGRALAMLASGATKDRVLSEIGQVVGLNDVSISVPAGSIYMIMGLSGSGKSTLARCINRLIEPSGGRILLDGEDIVSASADRLRELRRTRVSMVFQHFALLPNK